MLTNYDNLKILLSCNESILGQDENPILTQAKITSSKLDTTQSTFDQSRLGFRLTLDRLSIDQELRRLILLQTLKSAIK